MTAGNSVLICDICGSAFTNRSDLKNHLDKHRKLKCNVCKKVYQTAITLKYHLRTHFDANVFIVCDICGRSVSKWKLKRHRERHEPKKIEAKNYPCRYCNLNFDKVNNRSSHEKRIHKDKTNLGLDAFKCNDCSATYRTREELRDHSFEHFSGKIHPCDFPGCKRTFKKGKLVTVHKRSHFEPQVKCLDCGALFIQKSALSKHRKDRCPMRKPPKVVPENSELEKIAEVAKEQFLKLNGRVKNIPKILEDKSNKQEKTPSDDINEKQEPVAEEWQYEFLDEAMLELSNTEKSQVFVESLKIVNDHLQTNSEKLPKQYIEKFTCDFCGKTDITTKYDLQRHLQTHKNRTRRSKNYAHPCSINDCKEAFTSKASLIQHKRGYHGLRIGDRKTDVPYTCDFCGKEYYTRSSISTHLLVTHKKVKDFKCDECCRKFKSQGNLIRHKRAVHTEDKKFGCEKCGAMFKEKYQLEVHVHNHDEPTECNLCGRMVSNIKVHMRQHASKGNNILVNCPLCDKKFGKYQLVRHIKSVHEKQYQSDSTKSKLKVYTCKDCGEFFSRIQELRQHEYINHSQSKIYECNICGTFFKKLKLLNVHRFSHQPLNIACEICSNAYARKGALHKHQKKHHPELFMKK